MKKVLNVDVHHVTRVEGHGNIRIRVQDGEVKDAAWDVVETPRFFEVMLKGKDYRAAPILAARICGICSISHCLTSLRATEHALGVTVPPAAEKLRMLAKHAETMQSHCLHVFFLAAPDFFGLPHVLALLQKETQAYELAARLSSLARKLADTPMSIYATSEAGRKLSQSSSASRQILLREDVERALLDIASAAAPGLAKMAGGRLLMEKRPEVFHIARRLKGLANRLSDAFAGRTTHPVALQPGGVAIVPDRAALEGFRSELDASLADMAVAAELFSTFVIPDFVRETEYVALKDDRTYPFIGGDLASTDGVRKPEDDYLSMTNEYVTEQNTTKWCRLSRESIAVGALARFNINADKIHPRARKIATLLGLVPVCHNPFMNNVAQLVETVHAACESIEMIDDLLENGIGETMVPVVPRAGKGVGAVEAPRGILYHSYEYDREGNIVKANCVVPTTENNGNIHLDLHALARHFASVPGMTDEKLTLLCEMLVRSYDPCISCSVH